MLRGMIDLILGRCPRCEERQARINALEQKNGELLDRLMSRDYSAYGFVKAQTAPKEQKIATSKVCVDPHGDGLG